MPSAIQYLQSLCRAGVDDAGLIDAAVKGALVFDRNDTCELELGAQQEVLVAIFNDDVMLRHPPPRSSKQRVLKSILKLFDTNVIHEIDDDLYSACITGVSSHNGHGNDHDMKRTDEDGAYDGYRTLNFNENGSIVLRVTSFIGGDFETGSKIWSAGCAMASLIAVGAFDEYLHGHVLELGAGTGIVGLGVARRVADVTRVTLTDGQPAVVRNLQHNVDATASLEIFRMPLDVRLLEWGSPDLHSLSLHPVDVLVGSDLVYDATILPALASLLRTLLKPCGTATCAIIASAHRCHETLQKLRCALETEKLVWQDVKVPDAAWQDACAWLYLAHDRSSLSPEPCLTCEDSDDSIGHIRILRITALAA